MLNDKENEIAVYKQTVEEEFYQKESELADELR